MKRKKLRSQKRIANTCYNRLDEWKLVYDDRKRRFNLKFKGDMPTLQAIINGLKFKKD